MNDSPPLDHQSFASFKLQNAIEAIIGLQEGVTQPRVMEVYQTMETALKSLQYAVNEGMATRRMYKEMMERQDRIMDRLENLEKLVAALPADRLTYTPSNAASQQTGS